MPWKTRNGRKYYYRSVREGGRVVSKYVGAGESAGRIARLEELERDGRDEAAAEWRAERDRLAALDRDQAERFGRAEVLVRLALESAGFHRHNRGEWRRRRMGASDNGVRPVTLDVGRAGWTGPA